MLSTPKIPDHDPNDPVAVALAHQVAAEVQNWLAMIIQSAREESAFWDDYYPADDDPDDEDDENSDTDETETTEVTTN